MIWVTKKQVLELEPCLEWRLKIAADFPRTNRVSLAKALEISNTDTSWLISHMFRRHTTDGLLEAVKSNTSLHTNCTVAGAHALACYDIKDKQVCDFIVEWLEAHNETP